MAHVEIDRVAGGEIQVSWQSGAQPVKSKMFANRTDAERFAESKLGKRSGSIISTLDMTPDQLAALAAKKARAAEILARV